MLAPKEYPDKYDSLVDYLLDYDNGVLTIEKYVPFWVRIYLDSLDLIGPETDADLERIKAFILEEPTYERLNKLYDTIQAQMAEARGPEFHVDRTSLGRKYQVILNLLIGLHPKPFYAPEWEVSFGCYALTAFALDNTKKAILDERVRVALADFEAEEPHE